MSAREHAALSCSSASRQATPSLPRPSGPAVARVTPIFERHTIRLSCGAAESTDVSAASGMATPSQINARPSANARAASRSAEALAIAGRRGSALSSMATDGSSTPYICSRQMSSALPDAAKRDVCKPDRAASLAVRSLMSSDPGPSTTTGAAAGNSA
eukprot:2812231-Prymnesium_polylepis.1